jgi:rhamnosyltransferase
LTRYDYIAFADQDDIWLDRKLSYGINKILKKNVDAFSSNVSAFFEGGIETLIKKSQPQKKYDYYFESAGPGCTYVIKSNSLQKFKVFLCENFKKIEDVALHDWIIYAYFRTHQMTWHIDGKSLMKYRQHNSNYLGSNAGLEAFFKRLNLVRNGWYINQVRTIFFVVTIKNETSFKLEKLFLIKNFFHLRRSLRDAIFLLIVILLFQFSEA